MANGCVPVAKEKMLAKDSVEHHWLFGIMAFTSRYTYATTFLTNKYTAFFCLIQIRFKIDWYHVVWFGQLWSQKYTERVHINSSLCPMDSRKFSNWIGTHSRTDQRAFRLPIEFVIKRHSLMVYFWNSRNAFIKFQTKAHVLKFIYLQLISS